MTEWWIEMSIPLLGIICGLLALSIFKNSDEIKKLKCRDCGRNHNG